MSALTPALGQFFFVELAVRGRCGVDHQCLGVADVGQVAQKLARVDETSRPQPRHHPLHF
jgi:hypothetical protein